MSTVAQSGKEENSKAANQESKRPRTFNLLGIRVASTGMFMPENEVLNEDLASRGYDSEWIVQRTGIRARRHVEADQATSDLAIKAAQQCLDRSNTSIKDVDLILCATMTADHYTPSTACLVQAKLGATCGALDVNAACSGFLYAMVTASQFIKTGCYQKILVIGADTMSMVVDPEDKKTYPLFGDGAGAALLEADPGENEDELSGILGFRLASVGELADSLVVPGCGSRKPASEEVLRDRDQFLKMDGRTVFKWAVRLIPEIVKESLEQSNLTLDDVKLLLFHQANQRILKAATEDNSPIGDEMTAKEVELLTKRALEEAQAEEPSPLPEEEDIRSMASSEKPKKETKPSEEEDKKDKDAKKPESHEASLAQMPDKKMKSMEKARSVSSLPPRPSTPKPNRIEYTVQVAAYDTIEQAERHSQKLIDKGFPAFPVKTLIKGQEWYRVSVGSFKNRRRAMKYQKALNKQVMIKNSFVTKIKRLKE